MRNPDGMSMNFPATLSPQYQQGHHGNFDSSGVAGNADQVRALSSGDQQFRALAQQLSAAEMIHDRNVPAIIELDHALAHAIARNEDLTAAVRASNSLASEVNDAQLRLSETEKELAVAHTSLSMMDTLKKDLEDKIDRLRREEDVLRQQTSEVMASSAVTDEYNSRTAALTRRIQAAEESIDTERMKVVQYNHERDELIAQLRESEVQIVMTQRDTQTAKADAERVSDEVDQLRRDLAIALARVSDLTVKRKQAAHIRKEVETAVHENEKLRRGIEDHAAASASQLLSDVERDVLIAHIKKREERNNAMGLDVARSRLEASAFECERAALSKTAAQMDAARAVDRRAVGVAIATERLASEQRATDAARCETENFEHRARFAAAVHDAVGGAAHARAMVQGGALPPPMVAVGGPVVALPSPAARVVVTPPHQPGLIRHQMRLAVADPPVTSPLSHSHSSIPLSQTHPTGSSASRHSFGAPTSTFSHGIARTPTRTHSSTGVPLAAHSATAGTGAAALFHGASSLRGRTPSRIGVGSAAAPTYASGAGTRASGVYSSPLSSAPVVGGQGATLGRGAVTGVSSLSAVTGTAAVSRMSRA